MPLVVRAFPVRKSVQDLAAFAAELKVRREAAGGFYRSFGVSHESWYLQQTPAGPWVIVVNAVDDPGESAPRYARSNQEFDRWFKSQVLDLTGVDADKDPLGPPTSLVYEWSDELRGEAAELKRTLAAAT